ncbi:MAG: hypothetical protein AABY75_02500 [Bacteroidota bacterium]
MASHRHNFREFAVRTSLSFLFCLAIGLLRYGTVAFQTDHWSFQLVIYGFVYGLFLALWRVQRRTALAFLLVYFFAESAFLTGALVEHRALMVLAYFSLSAGGLVLHDRLFLGPSKRSLLREPLGLAVLLGIAYTLAAAVSLLVMRLFSSLEVDVLPNIMGAATIGFLLGLGVGLGHAVADTAKVREVLVKVR